MKISLNALISILTKNGYVFSIWCRPNDGQQDNDVIRFMAVKSKDYGPMRYDKELLEIVKEDKLLDLDCLLYYDLKKTMIVGSCDHWINLIKKIVEENGNKYLPSYQ
jgi:hypothetical protein